MFMNIRLLKQEHLPRFHSPKGEKNLPATNPTLDEIFKPKATKVVEQSEKLLVLTGEDSCRK